MGKIWEGDAPLNLLRKARTVQQTPQWIFRLANLDSQQNLYFLSCRVNTADRKNSIWKPQGNFLHFSYRTRGKLVRQNKKLPLRRQNSNNSAIQRGIIGLRLAHRPWSSHILSGRAQKCTFCAFLRFETQPSMTVCRKRITRSVRSPRFARRKNEDARHTIKSVNHVTTAHRRTLFACKIIHIQQGVDNLAADENCVVYCSLRPPLLQINLIRIYYRLPSHFSF